MSNVNSFLKIYSRVTQLINGYGFHHAIIFKGFSADEEHNLNILVEDQFDSTSQPAPQTTRKLYLKDKLTQLLKCNIVISTEDQMDPYYIDKLNSTNSVELTKSIPDAAIKKVFGTDWTFNLPLISTSFWPSSDSKKADEEPEYIIPRSSL